MTYLHKVQYYETDQMGLTHHSNYIRWMEEARVDLLERVGWGYDKMEALGIRSPVIGVNCVYKAGTTFGDTVEIDAWIKEYRGVHLVVGYEMRKAADGAVVLEGESRHCFLNSAGGWIRMRRDFPQLDKLLVQLAEKGRE